MLIAGIVSVISIGYLSYWPVMRIAFILVIGIGGLLIGLMYNRTSLGDMKFEITKSDLKFFVIFGLLICSAVIVYSIGNKDAQHIHIQMEHNSSYGGIEIEKNIDLHIDADGTIDANEITKAIMESTSDGNLMEAVGNVGTEAVRQTGESFREIVRTTGNVVNTDVTYGSYRIYNSIYSFIKWLFGL